MNSVMRTMLDRMARCVGEYPEIKHYVLEAMAQYRRHFIMCEPYQLGSSKSRGSNDQRKIIVMDTVLAELSEIGTERPLLEDHVITTIFHELLHSTTCNNRVDHNEIQGIHPDSKKACDKNFTMDRVAVVESLCMGVGHRYTKMPAVQFLAERMNMCGSDRGCRDLFTAKGNTETAEWPSEDLDDAAATKLCQRIKDDGMCLHFRNTQGETITRSNPKLQTVWKKMKERLQQIFPSHTNKIPIAFLALNPKLHERFEAIKDGHCFKRHFYINEKRPYEINSLRTKSKTVSQDSWHSTSALLEHLTKISLDYNGFVDKFVPDKCAEDAGEMKSIFKGLAEVLETEELIKNLDKLIRAVETEEDSFLVEKIEESNPTLIKLVGAELLGEFLKARDMFHYLSPNFDCVAAGLSPFRAMEASLKKSNPSCEQ